MKATYPYFYKVVGFFFYVGINADIVSCVIRHFIHLTISILQIHRIATGFFDPLLLISFIQIIG